MQVYNCALIGLGAIGMMYDYSDLSSITTHAKAISESSNFNLICGVDVDAKQRHLFEAKYHRASFESLNQIPSNFKIDVFVVAVNTKWHLYFIDRILSDYSPLAVLCEKPLGYDHISLKRLLAQKASSPLTENFFVNYIRRTDPSTQELAKLVQLNNPSYLIKGNCFYSKGLFNNSSHFFNLFEYLLGENTEVVNSSRNKTMIDDIDFDIDFLARFQKGLVYFQSIPYSYTSDNSFTLYFSHGKLSYGNCGFNILYEKYSHLGVLEQGIPIENDLHFYQKNVYANLYQAMTGLGHNLVTVTDAILTLQNLSLLS